MKTKVKILIAVIFGLFLSLYSLNSIAEAATYYMPDDFSNLQEAMAGMHGGDTLIIRDGVYTGDLNTITPYHYPPNGSEGAYTTIKAENVGKVIFDGQNSRRIININGNGMSIQPQYISFEGIIFRNSLGNTVSIVYANHIKIKKCGVYDAFGENGLTAPPLFFRYVDYGLVEDTFIFGSGGGYRFYMLDSNHLILRRCVDRYDRGVSTSGFHSSFRIYSSNHVEVQNCISIDANENYSLKKNTDGSLVPADAHFVIWSGGVNGPNDDVHIRGSIVLNNKANGRAYILQNSYSPQNNTVNDSVFWDIKNGLWTRLEVEEGTLFDHLTVGESQGGGITGEYGNGAIAKNSIIIHASQYGLQWTNNSNNSSDYNVLFENYDNYGSGSSPKPHDFCSENNNAIDPLTGTPGNGIPALKYLVRIEDGSDLDRTASDGGDRGATILYKIGRDGTLWGEPGYNEITNEPLWPFPNEDLIKEKMASYTYDDGSGGEPEIRGDRGFCADGTGLYGGPITLTSYIWEYLGNPCPSDICDFSIFLPLILK